MRPLLFVLPTLMFLISCNTQRGLFGKQTAHEKYSNRLKEAGLASSRMGAMWLNAASIALQQPVEVKLPFKENGYFPAEQPVAAGYSFNAMKGEILVAEISTSPRDGFQLFTELYFMQNGKANLLYDADTSSRQIKYEIEESGQFILRIQTELLHSVGYTLTITTAPSLAFPVPAIHQPDIGSFWGADRDGGARSHEGIDIFAPKRTPAVAAAAGRITRVNENRLGGKVVFMRPDGKNYNLYYAHLDEQSVSEGQKVNKGDIIGLIGNTGNAKTTPPHLHFGIYTGGGAVDPLPYVNNNRKDPPAVNGKIAFLSDTLRTVTLIKNKKDASISEGTPARVLGASGNDYRIILPGGNQELINTGTLTDKPLRNHLLKSPVAVYSHPDQASAVKLILPEGSYTVLGTYNNFLLIRHTNLSGWILK